MRFGLRPFYSPLIVCQSPTMKMKPSMVPKPKGSKKTDEVRDRRLRLFYIPLLISPMQRKNLPFSHCNQPDRVGNHPADGDG